MSGISVVPDRSMDNQVLKAMEAMESNGKQWGREAMGSDQHKLMEEAMGSDQHKLMDSKALYVI